MKRKIFIALSAIVLFLNTLCADEGMWMLPLLEKLNYATMQEMGLKLTPDQIYSINHTSLKDAIVIFGGGCTAEIISADGLLITNHHCGNDQIQNHSLGDKNYLRDGFWARSKNEELPNPGLTVTFLVSIEEVTDKVLENVTDAMSENERNDAIEKVSAELERAAVEGNHYEGQVRAFFERNRYFLFVYEKYLDVRLVGAPPEAIGNFGDETDNWMWPRYTGDFSMFRVYTGPDGNPAEYSPDNIPLKAKYHLPISLNGVHNGDFTMIIGNPGSTQRYITTWGLREMYEVTNPNRIKIRGERQNVLKEDMYANKKVYNMYSTKYQRSSNYWKYSIGQNRGIKRLGLIEKKQEEEAEFMQWVRADKKRIEEYGTVLKDIEAYLTSRKEAYSNLQKMQEVFGGGIEIAGLAGHSFELAVGLKSGESGSGTFLSAVNSLKSFADDFYSEYNLSTDKKVAGVLLKTYAEMTPREQRPDFYQLIDTKYKGNYDKYVDDLYKKSVFSSQEKLNAFLDKPKLKTLKKDPAFNMILSVEKRRYSDISVYNKGKESFERASRLYMKGRIEMNRDKIFYPDANFTMRLTYGKVGGYDPADAVHYRYYTTLKGVMEKEDPDNPEFILPEKLKKLYQARNFGRYGEKDHMPVCFTSNNDITGGNSGSPILNAKGELIGLAFDGNWEAMSGDIAFEPGIQKTINVDIRYVLFIIDKYAGAQNLIEEMTIVD
jgi:hypothetical protein